MLIRIKMMILKMKRGLILMDTKKLKKKKKDVVKLLKDKF